MSLTLGTFRETVNEAKFFLGDEFCYFNQFMQRSIVKYLFFQLYRRHGNHLPFASRFCA
jgi:hypothetical protein